MNILCGTDIIEISRIKKCIDELSNTFLNKIFTENEIMYCESKKNQKYQHYAARFAAKEAVFKAISPLIKNNETIYWKNIEINNNINGRPNILFIDVDIPQIHNIDISLSHCKEYATANVTLLYNNMIN